MAEFEAWKSKRTPIKAALTRFKKMFSEHDRNSGAGSLPSRLPYFEQLYEKFDEVQNKLDMLVEGDEEASQIQCKEREDFERSYFDLLTEVKKYLEQCASASNNSVRNQTSHGSFSSRAITPDRAEGSSSAEALGVKLPTITLPRFDGTFKDWLPFRDTFKSLIHENNRLSNIQRFHYLSSALTGDAARVIQSLGVSDLNYSIAWKSINERYEDPVSLTHYHTKCLFEISPLTKTSHASLRQLIDDVNNHLLALRSLGEEIEKWDTMIVYLVTSKLDQSTRREWEKYSSSSISRKLTLKDITGFLENHCKYLLRTVNEKPETRTNTFNKGGSGSTGTKSKPPERLASHATTQRSCTLCNESHALFNCPKLQKLSVQDRVKEVIRLRVCFNCLSPGHRNKQCTFGSCKKCSGKHNTLLHDDTKDLGQKQKDELAAPPPATQSILITNSKGNEHILFGTAIVWVKDKDGKLHECRALLDSCSQVHLMTHQFCQRLRLPLSDSDTLISGVGKTAHEPQHRVAISFQSRCTSFSANITCLVTPEITDDMPNVPLQRKDFTIPEGITLADPNFAETRPVDLLISAGLFWKLLCVGQIQLRDDQPVIQKTKLGWIIAGPLELPPTKYRPRLSCNLITNQQLHDEVARFWEIEHVSRPAYPNLDSRDICEQHFSATTKRDLEGRFVVTLPLKNEASELGESFEMARKRLLSVERKLGKQPALSDKYVEFMADYEAQGHMVKIQPEELRLNGLHSYLPHHAVFKEGSTTTKVRVVFDASAKTSSGLSFNDIQHVGPVIQSDLVSIALRFRQHKIVLSADIAQMYRQIKVTQGQQDLQRVLWRANPSQPIQHYRLATITYGTASAPFMATRALRQIGEENKEKFPITHGIIIRDFYVDDLLTGASTIQEAQQIKGELDQLLGSAGLTLRKWASNDSRVFKENNDDCGDKPISADKDPKTLGLLWNPQSDTLKYSVKVTSHAKVTKRTILSKIAQIFDPLGLVGPAVIKAKILLQKLWQLQIDWDESLPQDLHTAWKEFSTQLIALNEISVERRVVIENPVNVQLHGFSDASERAYGACIYLRTSDQLGNHSVQLLCAKSRVAPLKNLSLPRLELQAALLLAQLFDSVNTALTLKINDKYFWSDSTITLHWILAPTSRWKTYIANRTSEIQNLTNENWYHVQSQDNPADLISRGVNPEDLIHCELWWKGPAWLSQDMGVWPMQQTPKVGEMPEERKCDHTLLITTELDFSLLKRFSSLMRVIRVTAYCLRFCQNLKRVKNSRKQGNLDTQELFFARTSLVKLAQSQDFSKEINDLKEVKQVSKKSKLLSLNPFLDTEGILRVGGRLANASIPFDQKHPIILAPNNPLTLLIIKHEHLRLLHAGCQSTMTAVRSQFWPLACKNTVKGVLRKCIGCFRARPIGTEYLMANLPSSRVTPGRPFSTVGVDYAGPFYIKEKSRSRTAIKTYLCVFVCFATKAVHLELARDMSTDAFLHCLQRFISRRGLCKNIYSDNGTNFLGARNELQDLHSLLMNGEFQRDIHDFLANQQISWHMIPPNAPHFGGLWESAVKSAKKHLYRVIGDTRLTYEELYTILTQVESCLNSRPLNPLSNDPNDLRPLTPGHFLTGDSLTALPQPDLRNIPQNRLGRYQHLQQMLQHFWQRWQREYLGQLQERRKWAQSADNRLVPGTMVIVREDNLPPLKWRLGRITECHPGQDGTVRVVSIQVGHSILKRPVSKICILPVDEEILQEPTEALTKGH